MWPEYENQKAMHQAALAEFLHTDLDIAFTFLDLARTERVSDPRRVSVLTDKAFNAIQTVRSLLARITNPHVAAAIRLRTDSLESDLEVFTSK